MQHMILMSEKMMSQNKLYEIKSVPYNKPLMSPVTIETDCSQQVQNRLRPGSEQSQRFLW